MEKFRTVAAALQAELAALPRATPLDSERRLAERFGVARVTLRNAIDLLLAENLIHRSRRTLLTGSAAVAAVVRLRFLEETPFFTAELTRLLTEKGVRLELRGDAVPVSAPGESRPTSILFGRNFTPASVEVLAQTERVILCNTALPERFSARFARCDCDGFAWGNAAARHLLTSGCRRMTLLVGENAPEGVVEGFRFAVESARKRLDPALIRTNLPDTAAAGFTELARCNEFGMPDGIAVSGSALSVGFYLALQELPSEANPNLILSALPERYTLDLSPSTILEFSAAKLAALLCGAVGKRGSKPIKNYLKPRFTGITE